MINARFALALAAVSSLAMAGCATTGGGLAMSSSAQAPATAHLAHNSQPQTGPGAAGEIQQVSYETAAHGHEGCADCNATHGHGHLGHGHLGHGHLGHGHAGLGQRAGYCGCGRFSFSFFGSHRCVRCGLLRGKRCGRCGLFGIFGGGCQGCGTPFQTPHTPAYAGPRGPQSGTYAYPYYTTRGPRDFFMANPPALGY